MNANLKENNLTCEFYLDNNLLAVYDNGSGVTAVTYSRPYYISLMRFFHDKAFEEVKKEVEASYKKLKEDVEKHTNKSWTDREIDDLIDHCKFVEGA